MRTAVCLQGVDAPGDFERNVTEIDRTSDRWAELSLTTTLWMVGAAAAGVTLTVTVSLAVWTVGSPAAW